VVDPETIIVPSMIFIPATVIMFRMWLSHKRQMMGLRPPESNSPAIEARLARIEQAVEVIAVEMERVGEGQRFVTRLLAARSPVRVASAASAVPSGQVNTPH